MKKILLFVIFFALSFFGVIVYFFIAQKISNLSIPSIPSLPSVSDVIKFTRFSLEKAPSQSLVGKISSLSGEVKFESRMATEAAVISSPRDIQQGESLETGEDGKLILVFEKVAELVVSDNTKLGIIQTLPANLVFSQNTGKVEYKKLANIPVSIRSFHLLIENNGEVVVSVDKDKSIVTVKIINGPATVVYNNKNNDTKVINLEEGQILTFDDTTRKVTL